MNKEKGTVVNVTPLQQISDKFRKQDFTIKTFDANYPQFLTFQVVNDKCDLVRNLNTGDVVEVSYNLRGRRWEAQDGTIKYFNTIEAWTMSLSSSAPVENKLVNNKAPKHEESDDLPF